MSGGASLTSGSMNGVNVLMFVTAVLIPFAVAEYSSNAANPTAVLASLDIAAWIRRSNRAKKYSSRVGSVNSGTYILF